MTINPKDYDLEELRKMARRRGSQGSVPDDAEGIPETDPEHELDWNPLEEDAAGGGSMPEDGFRARLYRELMPMEAGSNDFSKPYLSSLPETESAEFLLFEWLEFLLLHGGFRGAQEAITYYESVDWLTEDVTSDLSDYLLGIEEPTGAEGATLDIDDHLLSLVYIAKLDAMH